MTNHKSQMSFISQKGMKNKRKWKLAILNCFQIKNSKKIYGLLMKTNIRLYKFLLFSSWESLILVFV